MPPASCCCATAAAVLVDVTTPSLWYRHEVQTAGLEVSQLRFHFHFWAFLRFWRIFLPTLVLCSIAPRHRVHVNSPPFCAPQCCFEPNCYRKNSNESIPPYYHY
eukprot:2382884-Heterocapsa_arctica.AAC.1